MHVVPYGTLVRNTVYDCGIGDPGVASERLGLTPASSEVDSMEREASRARTDRLSALVPVVSVQATLVAAVATNFMADHATSEVSEEVRNDIEAAYTGVGFATSMAVLSNLLDLGLVRLEEGR